MTTSASLGLALLFLLFQLLGVAALVLVGLDVDVQLHELRAEAFHLLAGRLADVVAEDAGPEALGRGDGLQARHPGAQHQHLRRLDGPGRRREQRKEARQPLGGDDSRPVAPDGAHCGEGVHALGPRDARHELHREGRDAPLGERPGCLRPVERVEQANQHLPVRKRIELLVGGRGHLRDDVRPKRLVPVDDRAAGVLVVGVGVVGPGPGARFDEDVEVVLHLLEPFRHVGHEAHTGLAVARLARNANREGHGVRSICR